MKSSVLILLCVFLLACGRSAPGDKKREPWKTDPQQNQKLLEKWQAVPVQNGSFYTVKRTEKVPNCQRCHNEDFQVQPKDSPAERAAHWDIRMQHMSQMQCQECHDKDRPELLKVNQKITVSLDHVYQMCGRCHFQELKDWHGGAHGKRLTGWGQVRIVENCSGCHNPHHPQFEKRYPKAPPTIVPTRLKQRSH